MKKKYEKTEKKVDDRQTQREVNAHCKTCRKDCKQDSSVVILNCPYYVAK